MKVVLMLAISLCGVSCFAAQSNDANYAIWTTSSLHKVMKTDKIGELGPVSIRAAGNEHEAFQIVLRPGRDKLEKLAVVPHDLTAVNSRISASNVSIFVPWFIYLPNLSAYYPDPLPPYAKPLDVEAGATQPLWIDVYVPKRTKAGDYNGRITLAPSNGKAVDVEYTLHVYNFDLPDESKLVTAFGLSKDLIAQRHGVQSNSDEAAKLYKKYYDFILDKGISSYDIPADIFSDEGAKYLTDPRVTSFVIPYKDDDKEQRKILDRVRSLGTANKGYFYFLDEPITQEQYNNLQNGCKRLRSIYPDVNIVSPYFRNPDFSQDKTIYDLLTGSINIWCFNTACYDYKGIDERRKAGDKIWDYVCCGPGAPYANFFVDFASLEHRMLMWQNYAYNVSGLLYWNSSYWDPKYTEDPWTNIATVGWISSNIYGDGSLLYPGKKVGIDGPVSSIRLENIRDGLEDYKYLWLLEQKSGREVVVPYVRKLVTNWQNFCRDPKQFESVRDEVAQAIEQKQK